MLVWKDKKGEQMVRKNSTPEQSINKLSEAEVLQRLSPLFRVMLQEQLGKL